MLRKITAKGRVIAFPTKIATCCHCGTKAALVLDQSHHALACVACGAPLRNLKFLPRPVAAKPAITHQPKVRSFAKPSKAMKPKAKKSKKRKSWFGERFKDMAEDLFDVVEDIFD